jgi:hypothetical protein
LKYLRHTIIENDDLSVFDLKANMTKAFIWKLTFKENNERIEDWFMAHELLSSM